MIKKLKDIHNSLQRQSLAVSQQVELKVNFEILKIRNDRLLEETELLSIANIKLTKANAELKSEVKEVLRCNEIMVADLINMGLRPARLGHAHQVLKLLPEYSFKA